jgi:hypothetical protein
MNDDDKPKGTINTQLRDKLSDKKFRQRKGVMLKAWQQWLYAIIAAMEEQSRHEELSDGMIATSELVALLAELEDCQAIGNILSGSHHDEETKP